MRRLGLLALVAGGALAALVAARAGDPGDGAQGSLASGAAVLGCAERALWGRVLEAERVEGGLRVTLAASEWVVPARGDARTTFLADDPAREVGAPAWRIGAEVLAVVSPGAPPEHFTGRAATRLVEDWERAGNPRQPAETCAGA